MLGPIWKLVMVSYNMCFINNSFMLRFISKLVVGSGLIHFSSAIWKFFDLSPHFISSSLLDSAAAVFIQFVQVGHLLSFFHFCPYFLSFCPIFPLLSLLFPFLLYPISYSGTFFSIDQGCTTFDELTKKVTLFPCFLFSSLGSLGRTHIIGLLKGEWCIGEYYFGFQRDFSVQPCWDLYYHDPILIISVILVMSSIFQCKFCWLSK